MTTEITLDDIPGCPIQVWGGWIWMRQGQELRWTKAETRDACEAKVLDVVRSRGMWVMDPEEN